MSSQAKIEANRRNARKSTGPKTEEGKAVVSQNAVRHGLLGRQDVVSWEGQEQFEIHRDKVLGELAPVGVMETILAERVVSLTWRLQRAQRMQTEAMNYLTADRTQDKSLASLLKALAQKNKPASRGDSQTQGQYAIGRSLCEDWANGLVLDRMLMYERRIESSLFRTSAELQRLQLLRKLEEGEDEASHRGGLPGQRQGQRAESGQSTDGPASEAEAGTTADLEETPDGVTTSELCETKPNSEGTEIAGVEQTPLVGVKMWEVDSTGEEDLACETKPMAGNSGRSGPGSIA
jgi:hypothetical protein